MFSISSGAWADIVALLIVAVSISNSVVTKLRANKEKVTLGWIYAELNFSLLVALIAWEMYPHITLKPEWATQGVFCALAVHFGARFIQIIGDRFMPKGE